MHVDTHHGYPSHTHLVAVMMFSAAGRSLPTGTSKSSGTVVMLNTLRPTPSDVPATVSLTPLPIDTMAEPGVGVNVGMATIFGDTTTAGGDGGRGHGFPVSQLHGPLQTNDGRLSHHNVLQHCRHFTLQRANLKKWWKVMVKCIIHSPHPNHWCVACIPTQLQQSRRPSLHGDPPRGPKVYPKLTPKLSSNRSPHSLTPHANLTFSLVLASAPSCSVRCALLRLLSAAGRKLTVDPSSAWTCRT